jgi:hypothetical protein
MILDRANETSRAEAWKGILDITNHLRQMELTQVVQPLIIDSTITPNLPTPEECIRILSTKMGHSIPSSLATALRSRIERLRQWMLQNYSETMSQLVSMSDLIGQDDSDRQREHSHSIEIWFNQAVEGLFVAITEQSEVRKPALVQRLQD